MRIFISIPSYGSKNFEYLNQVIDNFRSYKKYQTYIHVDATELNIILQNKVDKWILHDPKIKTELAWIHRNNMRDAIDKYDLFLYCEDDMLITEENIDEYLRYDKLIGSENCVGFLRYEEIGGQIFLVDQSTDYLPISYFKMKLQNNFYYGLRNLHQGCWLLTQEQLLISTMSPMYFKFSGETLYSDIRNVFECMGILGNYDYSFYPDLECAATSIYFHSIRKLIPETNIDPLLIKHLPNKYLTLNKNYLSNTNFLNFVEREYE